jgi:hypothetical protein
LAALAIGHWAVERGCSLSDQDRPDGHAKKPINDQYQVINAANGQ